MTRTWIAVVLAATVAGSVRAEEQAPKPGPETERLAYFVGKWKTTGKVETTPYGPGGKFSATEQCSWFAGKWTVVCRSKGKGPAGATEGLGLMSYSVDAKAYVYYGIDNGPMIMMTVPRGTFVDGKYTWDDESTMGGQVVKSRYVIQTKGQKSYESTWAIQAADGQYQTVMTATSTRQ